MLTGFVKYLQKRNKAKAEELEIILALKNIYARPVISCVDIADFINDFCPSLKRDYGNFVLTRRRSTSWDYGGYIKYLILKGFLDKETYLKVLKNRASLYNAFFILRILWCGKAIDYHDVKDFLLELAEIEDDKEEYKLQTEIFLNNAITNKMIEPSERDNCLRDLGLFKF